MTDDKYVLPLNQHGLPILPKPRKNSGWLAKVNFDSMLNIPPYSLKPYYEWLKEAKKKGYLYREFPPYTDRNQTDKHIVEFWKK